MVRYAIVDDAGLFFSGFRANFNRELYPYWDSGVVCIFDSHEEAVYSLQEVGDGKIVTLTITL